MSGKATPDATAHGDPSGHGGSAADNLQPASALDTVRTIAWSFLGVRRRNDHDRESTRINPIHVVVAGFAGVGLLVGGLILLVNLVAG